MPLTREASLFDYCPSLRESEYQSPRLVELERLFKVCSVFAKMQLVAVPLALLEAHPGLQVIKNREGTSLFRTAIQLSLQPLLGYFCSLPTARKQLLVEGWSPEPVLFFALRCE